MPKNVASNAPQEQFLKFSTPPLDEMWWRLELEPGDLRWIQENLGHGLDCQRRFRTTPAQVALTGAAYPGCPWRDRIAVVEGDSAPRVLVRLGGAYNYHEAYSAARKYRDPHLAPHGLFRRLESGFHKHAFQFMRQFGPLFIGSPTRGRGDSWWLSLADFWDKHARFVAVAKLWEDRFDPCKLHEHWSALQEQHERLDQAAAAPLGYIPDPNREFIPLCQMPWQAQNEPKLSAKAEAYLHRNLVYKLVRSELILHTQHCVVTWTMRERSSGQLEEAGFEPTRCFTSLWGVIWHHFGLDTRLYGWKVCQLCGKLFYPKDRRSVCCRTEHQSLWSKRQWARQHRIAMRTKKG